MLHEAARDGRPPRDVARLAPGRWTRVLLEHPAPDPRPPGFDEVHGALGALAGAPLPTDVATRLAPHVGREAAAAARLHTDAAADRVAAAHHARALAVGDDIYFARGEYAPGTARGDELLVHELTHVAQARRGALTHAAAKGLGSGGALDPAEAEADLRAQLAVVELHPPDGAAPPLAAPEGQPASDGERSARLADAYSLSPEDPWTSRAENDAEGVLIGFLHDLFGRYRSPNTSAQARWEVIRRDHPAYADAARSAASSVLARATAIHATELVRIDGGREVTDGRSWLAELVKALNTGVLSALH